MSTVKLFLVNALALLCLIIIIELFLGKWISDPNYNKASCMSKLLHHDNCPEIVWHNKMHPSDKDGTIEIAINRSRLRVASPEMIQDFTALNEIDVVNIGDSFMQSAEIPFHKTISHVLEELSGKKVIQVGYSSWAPIQYYHWLKANQLKKGVIINVFTFLNDFDLGSGVSNITYHQKLSKNGLFREDLLDENSIFSFINSFNIALRRKSYFVEKLRQVRNLNKYEVFYEKPVIEEDFSIIQNDCTSLEKYKNMNPRVKDYVVFAFNNSCWPEEYIKSVNSGVSDLKNILNLAQEIEAKVNIFLIPAGWSFKDEKVKNTYYAKLGIPEGLNFTSIPLAKYIQEKLKYKVLPFETVIKKLKEKHPRDWYFEVDGHWNEIAHKQLGYWLGHTLYDLPLAH